MDVHGNSGGLSAVIDSGVKYVCTGMKSGVHEQVVTMAVIRISLTRFRNLLGFVSWFLLRRRRNLLVMVPGVRKTGNYHPFLAVPWRNGVSCIPGHGKPGMKDE